MAGPRKYCKNKTKGTRRGRKWPAETRAGVLMDMIASDNICAVARKWGVPESTIRTWMAEELDKGPDEGSVFEQERRRAAREIALRAADGARKQVAYLQKRVDANAVNAEICDNLRRRLDEDTKARSIELGEAVTTEAERAEAAACLALVSYGADGTRDYALSDEEREHAMELMELHKPMDDRTAVQLAMALDQIAARAAAVTAARPAEVTERVQPVVEIAAATDEPTPEIIIDE